MAGIKRAGQNNTGLISPGGVKVITQALTKVGDKNCLLERS